MKEYGVRQGELWSVKIFRRTYWTSGIVIIVRDAGPTFGWIVQYPHMFSTVAIGYNHIQFIKRIQEAG